MKLPPAGRCASIANMRIRYAIAALLALSCSTFGQQKLPPQRKAPSSAAAADRLGMSCARILAMSSTDWIAKSAEAHAATGDGELRGYRVYGQCYDGRTDQLAAALARAGRGPKKAALADLKDFQQGLQDFTAKALADTTGSADPVKAAGAALYEKQFRYEFYQAYEQPARNRATPAQSPKPGATKTPDAAAPAPASASSAPPATGSPQSSSVPAAPKAHLVGVPDKRAITPSGPPPPRPGTPETPPSAAPPVTPPPSAVDAAPAPTKDLDPFTRAKNHFGELLGLLPDDKMHEVHAAFGRLFSGNPVSEEFKVDVYRYAIFLLEQPADQRFAPPPF